MYTKERAKKYHDGDLKGNDNIKYYRNKISLLCGGMNKLDVLDLGC